MSMLLLNLAVSFSTRTRTNMHTDQAALLALKARVISDPYKLLINWSSATSVYNWVGVTCGSRHRRVTALNLTDMNLSGTVPPNMGNLSFLSWLDMTNNDFRGLLAVQLSNLHRLKFISMFNNSFSGEISSWFGYFPKLRYLYLSFNNFTGQIPKALSNCKKIEIIAMVSNAIKVNLPKEMGNLTKLQFLDLQDNLIQGQIPSDIFDRMSRLQQIYLDINRFDGEISMILFKFKELSRRKKRGSEN
ncbi:hypothetical protein V6N12_046271 [Hibiscus sabdariffa]|uniref:Leucine-rich repeat-containing N-terminal plant-type domain-containing protein n=1 Tax=Hibiscus sabdariffa TaxID=183260 RepID=A0ABR1ZKQ4_9ROSI